MKICSHNHEEVVFDCKDCPVCDSENIIQKLTDKIKQLEEQISDMEI